MKNLGNLVDFLIFFYGFITKMSGIANKDYDYKKITTIGFWRMGADKYEIAYITELPIQEVEQIIDNYNKKQKP